MAWSLFPEVGDLVVFDVDLYLVEEPARGKWGRCLTCWRDAPPDIATKFAHVNTRLWDQIASKTTGNGKSDWPIVP